ncbi:MAG TPA: nitric oxide reductase activation protein NorD [Polyangiaceae bacterium]|nr:nitric oxide reductase activation protein NorD [Polyangiaceae bacterium]
MPKAFELAPGARAFVRALWGIDVQISPLPVPLSSASARPRFLGPRLWLPRALPPETSGGLPNYWLAAATHAAAHLRFGGERFCVRGLKPVQVAIISLLEDARVERLACEQYPGLFRLWAPFFLTSATVARTSVALLSRLARSLHEDASDPDPWVNEARRLFFAPAVPVHEPSFVRELGSRLGNELGQMRMPFNARDYVVAPAYRDDNLGLWQLDLESTPEGAELELERAESRATEARPAADRRSRSNSDSSAAPSALAEPLRAQPQHADSAALPYPEWDYLILRERPAFCTLREKTAPMGDAGRLDASLGRYAATRRRLLRAALRLAHEQRLRRRRLASGPRLDLRAAIAALLTPAANETSAPRVYRHARFQREPPALLVLIDASESLNFVPRGSTCSALELARRASALLGSTLNAVSRDWAIHGFSSNGRHDVGYFRFKDFAEPYDEHARARLAGMQASLSTRLGTALRHAGQALHARRAARKVLIVITDGEPSDVDVHDPDYLRLDAQRATQENRKFGVTSFCIGLDSRAESRIRCIFGSQHFFIVDRLERLPEQLSRLSLRLSS